MLTKLEQFIKNTFNLPDEGSSPEQLDQKLKVATTVLFLEMAYIDFNMSTEEEEQISKTLADLFGLESNEIADLIEIARQERDKNVDIWTFASLIKTNFSRDQKFKILEKLWLLIFADGKVDKYEDRLIHKISTLLGLEHGEMIAAKIKVQKKLSIE
jgi:uncharacterized tellurite resistance protein B-like protein